MSAAGQLHAIMFWILRSYCLRLNTGEIPKMKTINQIDATDVFFPVGTVCLCDSWDNCACLAVVLPASNHTLANNDAYHAT